MSAGHAVRREMVLPDEEIVTNTHQVLEDGEKTALTLLVYRIHLFQHFKAVIRVSDSK
jgi:hypothetical protein